MSEAKQLSKKEQTDLTAYSYEAGNTNDELDSNSYAIPRIAVLEKMSPEVDPDGGEHIEGAKAGLLYNKVMGELYESIKVIPVKRRRVYLEWTPHDQGGGFVAEHTVAEGEALMKQCTRNDNNVDITPNGTELHNVLEFYVLYSADDGASFDPAIISMSRTRMAEGKKWNMRIDSFSRGGQKISPHAQVYEVTTGRREKNGHVSYLFKVGPAAFLPEAVENDADVFAQAQAFLASIDSGGTKVDREAEAATTAQAGTGTAGSEFDADFDADF